MSDMQLTKAPSNFLTVADLAELLHVNEKKIYQLAGQGDLPGTKITGKWIFPRQLVDQWIVENCHGGVLQDRLLLAGSDDALIHQLCNRAAVDWQHSVLLSYSPCGTRHGLRMLDAQRADACFINWGASETHARRHLALLRGYKHCAEWIVVRLLEREQGLVLAPNVEIPRDGASALLHDSSLRWAMRQDDSGTQRLLQDACSLHQCRAIDFNVVTECNSERSAVAAVSLGEADITSGVISTAREHRLNFVPLASVAIDLVMPRRTYFRTLLQQLLSRFQDDTAVDIANHMGGYHIATHQHVISVNT